MSLLTYTTAQLIDRIRKKAGWTNNDQAGATDVDLIRHLNEAMFTEIIPRLMKVKEEYFVITRRIELATAFNENRYRIPKRAAGNKLRDLFYIDSSGTRRRLLHISREDLDLYSNTPVKEPEAYFLEGTHIVLVPELSAPTGSLEIAYFFRPGQLAPATETRQITSISGDSPVTLGFVGGAPSGWTTSLAYDIHSPDSGAQIKVFDISASVIGASSIGVGLNSVAGGNYGEDPVTIGDYICLAGEAAVPGVPLELHPVLIQATVVRMEESQGNAETTALHRQELDRMLQVAGYYFDYRVEGAPKKLTPRQGAMLFGGGR
jgi:hypothetical protein